MKVRALSSRRDAVLGLGGPPGHDRLRENVVGAPVSVQVFLSDRLETVEGEARPRVERHQLLEAGASEDMTVVAVRDDVAAKPRRQAFCLVCERCVRRLEARLLRRVRSGPDSRRDVPSQGLGISREDARCDLRHGRRERDAQVLVDVRHLSERRLFMPDHALGAALQRHTFVVQIRRDIEQLAVEGGVGAEQRALLEIEEFLVERPAKDVQIEQIVRRKSVAVQAAELFPIAVRVGNAPLDGRWRAIAHHAVVLVHARVATDGGRRRDIRIEDPVHGTPLAAPPGRAGIRLA